MCEASDGIERIKYLTKIVAMTTSQAPGISPVMAHWLMAILPLIDAELQAPKCNPRMLDELRTKFDRVCGQEAS